VGIHTTKNATRPDGSVSSKGHAEGPVGGGKTPYKDRPEAFFEKKNLASDEDFGPGLGILVDLALQHQVLIMSKISSEHHYRYLHNLK